MKPLETLDQTSTPDGTIIRLARQGDEYLLLADGKPLMSSRQHGSEEELARLYHEELLARGVRDYPWDLCWRDYRLHAAHGVIMEIVGAAITAPTERGDLMLSTLINRHALQMIDLDTLSLIRG